MKKLSLIACASVLITHTGMMAGGGTHSEQAVAHSAASGSNASTSTATAIAESGAATSVAVAVPLLVAGSTAVASAGAAEESIQATTAPVGTPLEITEESVTAGPPPDKALAPKDEKSEKTNPAEKPTE